MAISHGYTYQIKCYHCKMLISTEHTFFAALLDKVLQTSVKMSTKILHTIFYLCQFCLFFKVCKWDALQSDLGCRTFLCMSVHFIICYVCLRYYPVTHALGYAGRIEILSIFLSCVLYLSYLIKEATYTY